MSHEYDEPIYAGLIEAATRLTLQLRSYQDNASLRELAAQAVDALFCTCVTSAADAVVGKPAPVHAGLVDEVHRRAAREIDRTDPVERASRDSFPASDPPGWIWR